MQLGLDCALQRRGAGEGELAFDAHPHPAVSHGLETDRERGRGIGLPDPGTLVWVKPIGAGGQVDLEVRV